MSEWLLRLFISLFQGECKRFYHRFIRSGKSGFSQIDESLSLSYRYFFGLSLAPSCLYICFCQKSCGSSLSPAFPRRGRSHTRTNSHRTAFSSFMPFPWPSCALWICCNQRWSLLMVWWMRRCAATYSSWSRNLSGTQRGKYGVIRRIFCHGS